MSDTPSLFNLESKELSPYWIDPKQPLIIPQNPLHWKAHKLQVLMEILNKQAEKNPAQFNSKNYIDALNEYTKCIRVINGDIEDGVLDEGKMDNTSTRSENSPALGEGVAVGMDTGISADNPFAGYGSNSA